MAWAEEEGRPENLSDEEDGLYEKGGTQRVNCG